MHFHTDNIKHCYVVSEYHFAFIIFLISMFNISTIICKDKCFAQKKMSANPSLYTLDDIKTITIHRNYTFLANMFKKLKISLTVASKNCIKHILLS